MSSTSNPGITFEPNSTNRRCRAVSRLCTTRARTGWSTSSTMDTRVNSSLGSRSGWHNSSPPTTLRIPHIRMESDAPGRPLVADPKDPRRGAGRQRQLREPRSIRHPGGGCPVAGHLPEIAYLGSDALSKSVVEASELPQNSTSGIRQIRSSASPKRGDMTRIRGVTRIAYAGSFPSRRTATCLMSCTAAGKRLRLGWRL
jgi:hypothetical protein